MAKPKGLILRGSVWYSRVGVPKELVAHFGRREIWKSLGTSNRNEAEALHLREAANWKAAFVEASRSIKRRSRAKPSSFDRPVISDTEAAMLARRFFDRAQASLDRAEQSPAEFDTYERQQIAHDLNTQIASLSSWSHPDAHLWVGGLQKEILEQAGLPPEAMDNSSPLLAEYLRRALIQIHQLELARSRGDYSGRIADSFFVTGGASQPRAVSNSVQPVARLSVKSAIERFQAEELDIRSVTPKTNEKRRALLKHVEQFFGSETDVSEVSRSDCNEFRSVLSKVAPNFGKQITKRVSMRSLAEANKSERQLAWETQNSYLRMADDLFGWLVKERLIGDNPAIGIIPLRKREAAETQRLPFDATELEAIFNAPIYTGCVDDENGFAKPGPNIIKRSRYWVPLLALYSGMRMGEILQLTPGHIRRSATGTDYIVLTRDMVLKSDAAEREIPVHPVLLRLGFLDWVEQNFNNSGELLFADVPPGKHGYRSDTFTKRFATALRKIEISPARKAKLSFHSFRHNFRDALSETGASEEIIEEVCGWSRGKRTGRRYGTGLSADRMKPFVDQIRYDFDLSHLPTS